VSARAGAMAIAGLPLVHVSDELCPWCDLDCVFDTLNRTGKMEELRLSRVNVQVWRAMKNARWKPSGVCRIRHPAAIAAA